MVGVNDRVSSPRSMTATTLSQKRTDSVGARLFRLNVDSPKEKQHVSSHASIRWFACVWSQLQVLSLAKDLAKFRNDPLSTQGFIWGCMALMILITFLRPRSPQFFLYAACLSFFYAMVYGSRSNHVIFNAALSGAIILTAIPHVGSRGGAFFERWLVDLRSAGFWLTIIVYFVPWLHKLNWDFLKPRVSCASQVTGSLLGQFGFQPSDAISQLVIATSPVLAILTEFILPVALWRLDPKSYQYRFFWIIGIFFHVRFFFC